jgi:hypothetical protein
VSPTLTVFDTSIELYSKVVFSAMFCCGGIIFVMYPTSS